MNIQNYGELVGGWFMDVQAGAIGFVHPDDCERMRFVYPRSPGGGGTMNVAFADVVERQYNEDSGEEYYSGQLDRTGYHRRFMLVNGRSEKPCPGYTVLRYGSMLMFGYVLDRVGDRVLVTFTSPSGGRQRDLIFTHGMGRVEDYSKISEAYFETPRLLDREVIDHGYREFYDWATEVEGPDRFDKLNLINCTLHGKSLDTVTQRLRDRGVMVMTMSEEAVYSMENIHMWLISSDVNSFAFARREMEKAKPKPTADEGRKLPRILDDLTFGVELEMILPVSPRNVAQTMQDEGYNTIVDTSTQSRYEAQWKITSDGSISRPFNGGCPHMSSDGDYCDHLDDEPNCDDCSRPSETRRSQFGFELVSPVLYGKEGIEKLLKLFAMLKDMGMSGDQSCSMHVHIGADDIIEDPTRVRALMLMTTLFEPFFMAATEFDRSHNHYCAPLRESQLCKLSAIPVMLPDNTEPSDYAAVLKDVVYDGDYWNTSDKYCQARYRGLNIHSMWYRGTVEFRYFNLPKTEEQLLANLIVCARLFKLARDKAYSSISRLYRKLIDLGNNSITPEARALFANGYTLEAYKVLLPEVDDMDKYKEHLPLSRDVEASIERVQLLRLAFMREWEQWWSNMSDTTLGQLRGWYFDCQVIAEENSLLLEYYRARNMPEVSPWPPQREESPARSSSTLRVETRTSRSGRIEYVLDERSLAGIPYGEIPILQLDRNR